MQKTGLVGGISWVSTLDYYRLINEGINARSGGLNYAECVIYSLNFGDIQEKTWENCYDLLFNACDNLRKTGVAAIALCANTAHLYADRLQTEINLPFIHIGVATANAVKKQGVKKVGLLGTRFTMELDFYRNTLEENGLEVLVPQSQTVRDYIQYAVKEELGRGIVREETRSEFVQIVNDLAAAGAAGIILGCTEIPMLLSQNDVNIPVFDTTAIHAQAIVDFMLSASTK